MATRSISLRVVPKLIYSSFPIDLEGLSEMDWGMEDVGIGGKQT